MNNLKTIRQACLLIALLATLGGTPAAIATLTHPFHCNGTWTIVPTPNTAHNIYSALYAVAAVSDNDVWTVGWDDTGALIEHWNGSTWNIVPNPAAGADRLLGVTALSVNNVWAVGTNANQSLIEHWDGTNWSIVPSPNPGVHYNILDSVVAISATDIWAVGLYTAHNNRYKTLIEHWDGAQWSVSPSPNPHSGYVYLNGVTAVSSQDVWAVGFYPAMYKNIYALTEHWDGHTWREIPDNIGYSALEGAIAINASDILAVGIGSNGALIERWNGRHWHIVQNNLNYGGLTGVAAWSINNIWAVGSIGGADQTVTEHWDGTIWQLVPSPNIEDAIRTTFSNNLTGVAISSAHSVWAVGYYHRENGYSTNTLIEHYC